MYFSPANGTIPAHHILLNLIILITSGKEQRQCNSFIVKYLVGKGLQTIVSYWIPNNNTIRPTGKATFDKTYINLGS
jgi:hypothetical protein